MADSGLQRPAFLRLNWVKKLVRTDLHVDRSHTFALWCVQIRIGRYVMLVAG